MVFNSIFGTPNKDMAAAEQGKIMFSSYSEGNAGHNSETQTTILKELAQNNHLLSLSNIGRRIKAFQSATFKNAENVAKFAALKIKGSTGEGSVTAEKGRTNIKLGLYGKLAQATAQELHVSGEDATRRGHIAYQKALHQYSDAVGKSYQGTAAKLGHTYVADNNAKKAFDLTMQLAGAATKAGTFGQYGEGSEIGTGNVSAWDAIFRRGEAYKS
tara:strand:+ start:428 stop:1072 length:645 start_codon:yes stop_codon:yes gene_type:complete